MWTSIIGQEKIKEILQRAIEHHRVAHAYIFLGQEGVGKDALAIEFAATLLCQQQTIAACGECPSCKKMSTLQHPDLKLIFPMPGGDTVKNDDDDKLDNDVRDEVRRQISEKALNPYFHIEIPKASFIRIKSIREIKKEAALSSVELGKKIFIIFDTDMMNDASANSLLKVLEEPNDETIFLLTSSRKEQVKQTILSRCQAIHCAPLHDVEIALALLERAQLSSEQAKITARLANGNYRRALELLSDDVVQQRNDAVQLLRMALGNSALKFFDEIAEFMETKNRDKTERLLMFLLVWFRDALMLKEYGLEATINRDQKEDLERFVAKFGNADLAGCIAHIERTLELLQRNVYLPLVMLSFTVQLKRTLLNGK